MTQQTGKGPGLGPVWASIGGALRFAVENWRFALIVAALGASLHVLTLIALGPNLLWLVLALVAAGIMHAAFIRAALSGVAPVRVALAGDVPRLFAAMAIVGLFVAMVIIVVSYVAMSVLIAPYANEVAAAKDDPTAVRAVMERAIQAQPNVVASIGLVGALFLFALTSRFYFVAPASLDQGRVLAFQSWVATRGHTLRIMAARLVLLAPALVFVLSLTLSLNDLVQGQAVAGALGVIWLSAFVQLAVYGALEAGLSAQLYRNLAPPPQPKL